MNEGVALFHPCGSATIVDLGVYRFISLVVSYQRQILTFHFSSWIFLDLNVALDEELQY
jgi:hypothetical protein